MKKVAVLPFGVIFEDNEGYRILVTSGDPDPTLLPMADEYGVSMLLRETPRSFRIGNGEWIHCEGFPTYFEALEQVPKIEGPKPSRFVHLHTHSEFSALDGFSTIDEIVAEIKADGQQAVAVTDHGTCAGHPYLQKVAEKEGIRPIMGIEAYFVDDRFRRAKGLPDKKRKSDLTEEELAAYEQDSAEVRDYWHLILLAENNIGLRNIWAMSTEANKDGYYRHPRLDWDTLQRHSEGVICMTACLRGPISRPILADDLDLAVARMNRLRAIFGDRLYAEIHTNNEADQYKVNIGLTAIARTMDIPIVAVSDSHYSCHAHSDAHAVWIAAQTGKSINDDSDLFSGDAEYHLLTEDEVRASLSYLPADVVEEAIENTNTIANKCQVTMKNNPDPPHFGKEGDKSDMSALLELCMANWERKTTGKTYDQQAYRDRFEMEMGLLIEKRFCGYFLMVADYCLWAKGQGILVGPARGSGGGSLVAYLCGITELDPVECDLLFDRFMTKGRKELPDFDVDFPSSRIDEVYQYVTDRWGEDYVVRVGTHLRLKNKGVIRKLASALKGSVDFDWMDIDAISRIIDQAEAGTAGMGVSWDELWAAHADQLGVYKAKYPVLFHYASLFVGRLNSYGKHAAGIVISSDETLTDQLPLRMGDDGRFISEYDMNALAELGLVKFDFLGIRTLDTLQKTINLIRDRRGETIDPYMWKAEYSDQDVWNFISDGNTLGMFQIETPAGTRQTRLIRPTSLHELADVVTLDRPGPMRSGLDKTYLARRNGKERITYPDPRLEPILNRSYGVIIYQEDIMNVCMTLAGYDSEEADTVRKILGKKKIEEAKAEGRKFVGAAVERGMDGDKAEALWGLMEEFALYAFNRAHAFAYATLAYWTAYLKYHYPQEFYTACLSTVDKNRLGDFIVDAQKRGFKVLPPDINRSEVDFSISGNDIVFGLGAIKGIGAKAQPLVDGQPYASIEDLRDRSIVGPTGAIRKIVDAGCFKILNRVGALESIAPNRKQVEVSMEAQAVKANERCAYYNPNTIPEGAPVGCSFDWTTEPVVIGKRGTPLKPKPIPKRCSVACRHYEEQDIQVESVDPYTDAEIREFEMEYLGNYLSSTPFDQINATYGSEIRRASELESYDFYQQAMTAGIVRRMTEKFDRNGRTYGLLALFAQDGIIDAICFHDSWKAVKTKAHPGDLVLAMTKKNHRGYQIIDIETTQPIKEITQ